MFSTIKPTAPEIQSSLPGDNLVPDAIVVLDRAFTLRAKPELVWPWFMQLGKRRAGWYLPRSMERYLPARRRALRHIDQSLQALQIGTTIPDWGGKNATLTVALLEPNQTIVYTSRRGHTTMSWAIICRPGGDDTTRVLVRLRLSGVKHPRLVGSFGSFIDALTIVGLAAGLRERVEN